MPKDFAKSSAARRQAAAKRRQPGGARTGRDHSGSAKAKKQAPPRSSFSPLSFASGVIIGVAGVLVVLNGLHLADARPALITDSPGQASATETTGIAVPPKFEFWDRLPNDEVAADTSPYESETEVVQQGPREYLIQAASFRSKDDAERMRANLLLAGMEAATIKAALGKTGTWYRVVIGPFTSRLESQRAMTRLRQQNISALLLERTASAG